MYKIWESFFLKITFRLDVFPFNPTTSELSNYFRPTKTAKSHNILFPLNAITVPPEEASSGIKKATSEKAEGLEPDVH
jgi:hypothetical protein